MRRYSALFHHHLMERRWNRKEETPFFPLFVFHGTLFERDQCHSHLRQLSTQLSSACSCSPLKNVETSGIKLHILFLPSFHFAFCHQPQNEGDVTLPYILVRFYLDVHMIPNQKLLSMKLNTHVDFMKLNKFVVFMKYLMSN